MKDHGARSPASVDELLSICLALGAADSSRLSRCESRAIARLPAFAHKGWLSDIRQRINAGHDPLGEYFCGLRSARQRRQQGATYTPSSIVRSMIDWAASHPPPDQVVDPGMGSGRYLLAAGRQFPNAELLGVDIDPVAALMTRANLSAAGMIGRAKVIVKDFRSARLPAAGRRLFMGNPPYVRHHQLTRDDKQWLTDAAATLGMKVSQLSGLYVHFLLATAKRMKLGDLACFITAGEWLQVNYGDAVRELLLNHLGCAESLDH